MFTWQKLLMQEVVASSATAGQVVLLTGTTSWTVPAGVTGISVVAVQGGSTPIATAGAVTVTVNSVIVCRAQNGARVGDGGGEGGLPGPGYYDGEFYLPGSGGGAAGYSGNGGRGGGYDTSATNGNGGGGGGGNAAPFGAIYGYDGGGVGLLGQGSNGAVTGTDGNPGSNGTGKTYGGGLRIAPYDYPWLDGGRGGALAYKNNIAVTPGQTITLSIPATLTAKGGAAGAAAVRIIWGAGRSFPSTNTGDM